MVQHRSVVPKRSSPPLPYHDTASILVLLGEMGNFSFGKVTDGDAEDNYENLRWPREWGAAPALTVMRRDATFIVPSWCLCADGS